jgi:spermidine synthase
MMKRITFALILVGFTSMGAQIVLMRQLLIIFYGNELSLGITLASWLLWIALGSWLARAVVTRLKEKLLIFTLGEMILAFLLPLSILGTRFIPQFFRFSPGEIVGVLPMSIATFILLSPICVLGGFLFVLGCSIYRIPSYGAVQIGKVYVLEAIGATSGGLLVSLVLIKYLGPLYIMVLVGLLNLIAAFLLLWDRKAMVFLAATFIVGFILLIYSGGIDFLRTYSLRQQWKGYTLLASQDSVYGNIAVTKREDIYSIFINGLYDFSVPDEFSSEWNAHFPLLEHPQPRDILLVGGGSSGQLREVLKHPIRRVDYVELDPLLIDSVRKYLPPDHSLKDPRVRVIADMDGRLFIKRTNRRYDVVIINLPEPHTAQLNRFYTQEFYTEVKRILKDKGLLSFSLSSNPNYISREQVQLYRSLKDTLEEVFAEVVITPGKNNFFLASTQKGMLTLDWRNLIKRLKQRSIQARYIREYYLFSELSRERIEFFSDQLARSKKVDLNRDFHPIGYYYDMVLWSTFFKYNLKRLFEIITAKKIYVGWVVLCLILFIPACAKPILRRVPNWGVLACVGTTGFAEITFQIITLLAFQVLYGYVYYKLGLILTSFMIGLILGGWLVTKRIEQDRADYNLFIKTQVAIFIYPLILPLLFWGFSLMQDSLSFFLGANIVFPFLPIIAGLIGGFQFPLANSLYIKRLGAGIASSVGLTYGIDLFGACLGAILTSVFLIPIIGIPMTCFLVAGLNLVGLALLWKTRPLS